MTTTITTTTTAYVYDGPTSIAAALESYTKIKIAFHQKQQPKGKRGRAPDVTPFNQLLLQLVYLGFRCLRQTIPLVRAKL